MTTSPTAPRLWAHAGGFASGMLAAAICMAICQLIGLIFFGGHIAQTILYGISLSAVAFGGTYAATFFVARAGQRKEGSARVGVSAE